MLSDVKLNIVGYSGSTQVPSLLEAFESMNITVMLPGLNSSLLSTGSLESESCYSFEKHLLEWSNSSPHHVYYKQHQPGDS